MPSITCFVTLKRLVRFVSMTAVQSSCVILRNTTSRVMPALLTSTSTSPTSDLTLSNAFLVDSQSPTLPSDAMKSKPRAFCSSSHFTRRGEFGPQPATTVKPSLSRRWQMLVPMPPIPPVTYATRFVMLDSFSLCGARPTAPPACPFRCTTSIYCVRRLDYVDQGRSSASATPMPPPMHSDANPRFASRFCISCSSVTRIRQPDAPIGCPIAIAPPFTLIFD